MSKCDMVVCIREVLCVCVRVLLTGDPGLLWW